MCAGVGQRTRAPARSGLAGGGASAQAARPAAGCAAGGGGVGSSGRSCGRARPPRQLCSSVSAVLAVAGGG
eukprot:CAMPEP_0204372540 /NCGR_PEP_ID=MMETSP0469-20131031/47367_1 /ASSEMBLY_ACC=CAM_ASM_000384 /TAXON_ID=2969 /ORGANISM="Oxyrrhis marina" /LENGTH=70 /DNA_ID=CAMNT_0051362861 /DNA_START=86 /DNA_END=294 /DNA_ORIENTATION=-